MGSPSAILCFLVFFPLCSECLYLYINFMAHILLCFTAVSSLCCTVCWNTILCSVLYALFTHFSFVIHQKNLCIVKLAFMYENFSSNDVLSRKAFYLKDVLSLGRFVQQDAMFQRTFSSGHRIKDDRMEKPLKGRRFMYNLL